LIARRKTAHGSGLGSQRWVVERTLSWLHQHQRLRIRYERKAEMHEALLSLACSLICLEPSEVHFVRGSKFRILGDTFWGQVRVFSRRLRSLKKRMDKERRPA
jgi:hypothetical protein